eukprot:CFRG7985T1
MKITMVSLVHLVGFSVYLASTGSHATSVQRRTQHSLTPSELEHLIEVTDDVANEGRFEFEFVGENPLVTDEFSVKLSDSGECRVNIHSTDGGFEWISNINTVTKSVEMNGEEILKAHAGFTIGALAVDEQLDGAILKNCGTPEVLTFLGHSRGGGIAAILAAMYYRRGGYEIKLTTWGSPRAMTTTWADYYQEKFYQIRVVNDNDVVTTVPPNWFGFKHYGDVVCLDCDDTSQDAEGGFSVNVLNHLMYNYNSKIKSIEL